MTIHSTAIVDPGAELGANVTIDPYAVIDANVRIGDNVCIGPHVVICAHTTIGADCNIHAGAVLGDLPQDLAFKDAVSYVRIGSKCVIREGVTIHRGTKPETETVVGDGCFLMVNSHLAHNVRLGAQVVLANGALLAGYVDVGDRAFISGNAVIHQFCRVGRLAMLGGGGAISKDIPPFCIVRYGHINEVAGLNTVGLRRGGFTAAERLALKQAFQILYRSNLNVSQAVAKIRSEIAAPQVVEFCDFIETSKRGICRFEGLEGDEEE